MQAQSSLLHRQSATSSKVAADSAEIETAITKCIIILQHFLKPKHLTISKLLYHYQITLFTIDSSKAKTLRDINTASWSLGDAQTRRGVSSLLPFILEKKYQCNQFFGRASLMFISYRRSVIFIEKDGQRHTFKVADGDNLLDIAQANDLEMEGACGGSCACSTCHVIVEDEAYYDKMEEPTDEENDMLDLAFGLTETSRLGCQVKMNKELDGLTVKLPNMTRNLQASDFETK